MPIYDLASQSMQTLYDASAARAGTATHTGNTSLTALATYTLPAGLMGPNDTIQVYTLWDATGITTSTATARVIFGGTNYMSESVATSSNSMEDIRFIHAANSVSAQFGGAIVNADIFTETSRSLATSTVNTASNVAITASILLGNAGDTMSLRLFRVSIIRGA